MTLSLIVTGKQGQLGRDLVRLCRQSPEVELRGAYDHSELDISDRDAVMKLLDSQLCDASTWLVNAAAYTAVDRCEEELELSLAVNGEGPGHLAEACRNAGAGLVQISTDYVFDGTSEAAYPENAPVAPSSAYGRSKLDGERRVLESGARAWVIRTSWVFGPGKNFVGAILRQAFLREQGKQTGPLRVVDDQRGCPTYSADLAAAILQIVTHDIEPRGLLHFANQDPCTWWDFARAILDETGFEEIEIERSSTAELDLPAPRPRNSVLDCSRAESLDLPLRGWREALTDYLSSPDGAQLKTDALAAAEAA